MSKIIEKMSYVNATDMPNEVEDYCIEREISTHCQNDIACVEDDGNVLAEWLKENGLQFQGKDYMYVGIIAS